MIKAAPLRYAAALPAPLWLAAPLARARRAIRPEQDDANRRCKAGGDASMVARRLAVNPRMSTVGERRRPGLRGLCGEIS
jgi:hypothetical protein